MSESTRTTPAAATLLPHQLSLINAVFESTNRRVFLLSAQAGLGKTSTLVALAQRLFSTKPLARLLVLGPTVVAKAYRDRLQSAGAPAVFVEVFRFREIRNAIVHGTTWPVETSIMMSLDDLATQDDIATTLALVDWDMVIVDDVDNLSDLSRKVLSRHVA